MTGECKRACVFVCVQVTEDERKERMWSKWHAEPTNRECKVEQKLFFFLEKQKW